MRYILTGAAAIALAVGGAHAQPGKNNGNGKPATAAKSQGNGQESVSNRAENGSAAQNRRSNGKQKANRGNDNARSAKPGNMENRQGVEKRNDRAQDRQVDRPDNRRDQPRRGTADRRARYADRDMERLYDDDRRFFALDRSRDLIAGCPPGLDKKRNGCQPPGQPKQRGDWGRYYDRSPFGDVYRPRLFGLTNYAPGDYYYDDGYLLRREGGGIGGYIPLLAGALAVGNPWPQSYDYYPVSDYYVDYYNLGAPDRYRYADNVIYRVDPDDEAITSVAALLTGDDIAVGQPMPRGYDVYNVPYGYRDRYYDTPAAHYRYSDGYVYRIDPETQLVSAVIDLLV